MGLYKQNYESKKLGIVLPEAYALIKALHINGEYGRAIFEIQTSRDNCFEKEPIEWRVLSVNGEEALLLADKGMDCKHYNEKSEDVTWETCTLRTWLNNEFYNEVFNETEQKAIKDSLLNK